MSENNPITDDMNAASEYYRQGWRDGHRSGMYEAEHSQHRARFDRYVCALARLHPEKSIDTVVERAALLYERANAKWEAMNNEAKGEQR